MKDVRAVAGEHIRASGLERRDEAAAGRDTGRLVPVTLDGTAAPLGFRQFQTIDLSHWKGRSNAPELSENTKRQAGGDPVILPFLTAS